MAQHEGDVHAFHRHVGVVAEAHIGVSLVEHHIGCLHVFKERLHKRKAEVIIGIFNLAKISLGLAHQFVAVARESVFAQAEECCLIRGIVIQRLLILFRLIISLELRGRVYAGVVFQFRQIAKLGAGKIHHVSKTLV